MLTEVGEGNLLFDALIFFREMVCEPLGAEMENFVVEAESADYAACRFLLDGVSVCFRVSKITPTKVGQFVTLWKRKEKGPIQPLDVSDEVDVVVICARKEGQAGLFVFPTAVLSAKDIFSVNGKGGKRGIRVYPSWDETTSKQARKTQEWQLKYFLKIATKQIDIQTFRQLLNN